MNCDVNDGLIALDCDDQQALCLVWSHCHIMSVKKSSSAAFKRHPHEQRPWKVGILADIGALFLLWSSLCFNLQNPQVRHFV